jgi:hypothetical protein
MTATIRERSFKNKSRLRPADRDLTTGAGFDETDHAHLLDVGAQADAVPVRTIWAVWDRDRRCAEHISASRVSSRRLIRPLAIPGVSELEDLRSGDDPAGELPYSRGLGRPRKR